MAKRREASPPPPAPKLWQSFKRQSIQEAVIRIMCREGLDAVTMERVAQEVGIAKGTVYLHYHDKQELLEDVKDSALDPLLASVLEVLKSSLSADRKLAAFVSRYLFYFDQRRELFRILLYERTVTRVQGRRYQGERYRQMLEQTTAVIKDGVAAGVFRRVDPQKSAAIFLESNYAILNQRLLTDDRTPVEDDARLIAELFLAGIAAPSRTPRAASTRRRPA
jgi:AcrR family transcriptional regulator